MSLEKNTILNIKITRDPYLMKCDITRVEKHKNVRYSPDTVFDTTRKKSTTTFDKHGKIIRPIIVNNLYYIRHDKLPKRL